MGFLIYEAIFRVETDRRVLLVHRLGVRYRPDRSVLHTGKKRLRLSCCIKNGTKR